MNYKMMGRFLAQILFVEALFMVPALLISLYYRETGAAEGFLWGIGVALAVSGALFLLCKGAPSAFYARDGLVCVGLSWIVLGLVGCMPFCLSREIPAFIDAFFETVSGFTTTGATILPEVESLSRGILYWRSFTHWLGGMGVLVFLLAFTGAKGQGYTMHLLRAESPGPDVGKLVPKMRRTAGILYLIYIGLTVANFLFLVLGDMSVFDAVCTALGTAGTGGFGIRNDSMASYSPYIQNVCTVFMLIFGVNFSCYYLILIRQVRSVLRDEELRVYAGIVAVSIGLITLNIRPLYQTLGETVRHAAFQVASIISTSGFATTDFDLWPAYSKGILLTLLLIGGCAGSTAGGFKVGRLMLLVKSLGRNTRQMVHPRKVQVVRSNGSAVDEKILANANAYLAAYMIIIVISFLVVSLDNFSFTTNLTAVLTCFNNVGPGLDMVGPTGNFGSFGILSKLVLILDMLAGRLEIFPMLVLLSRDTWRSQ